jgi:hypothetical protein
VDALAPGGAAPAGEEEIELAPADDALGTADPMAATTPDSGLHDAVALDQIKPVTTPGKEDTAITSEGISIFDEEDLDVELADPMAKTQIAPSLEDQVSIDGVGSGSGLLDLTRESDDTSLGAELWDGIDGEAAAADVGDVGTAAGAAFPTPADEMVEQPAFVEAIDRNAGLYQGLVIGAAILGLVCGGVMLAAMVGLVPGYLQWLQTNMTGIVVGLVGVVGVAALAGWHVGRSAADRKLAMRQAGGGY